MLISPTNSAAESFSEVSVNDIKSVKDKNADKVIGNIVELDIKSIEVNPFQPRTKFLRIAVFYRSRGPPQPATGPSRTGDLDD